jgi:hypothetical protein
MTSLHCWFANGKFANKQYGKGRARGVLLKWFAMIDHYRRQNVNRQKHRLWLMATPCESIPQPNFFLGIDGQQDPYNASDKMPRTSKNAQRTSDRFNAHTHTAKGKKMKMSDDNHSDRCQSKYIHQP